MIHDPLTGWQIAALLVTACVLSWSTYIDLKRFILPDSMTAIAALAGLLIAVFDPLAVTWKTALDGLAAGLIGSWLIREAVWHLQQQEALGLGDVKLFGAAGLWVGPEGVISVAFYGAVLTMLLVVAKWALTRRGSLRDIVPFGPGLAVAIFVTLAIGPLGTHVNRLLYGSF